jgi:hypothetical protein
MKLEVLGEWRGIVQSEQLLLYTEWAIVVIYRVSNCCYIQSERLLLYTEWAIVVIYRVSNCTLYITTIAHSVYNNNCSLCI